MGAGVGTVLVIGKIVWLVDATLLFEHQPL
jgi:hypothetical protein